MGVFPLLSSYNALDASGCPFSSSKSNMTWMAAANTNSAAATVPRSGSTRRSMKSMPPVPTLNPIRFPTMSRRMVMAPATVLITRCCLRATHAGKQSQ